MVNNSKWGFKHKQNEGVEITHSEIADPYDPKSHCRQDNERLFITQMNFNEVKQ
jgi:hypothetical protein